MKDEDIKQFEKVFRDALFNVFAGMSKKQLRKIDWLSTPERAQHWINADKDVGKQDITWESEMLKVFELTHAYETMPPVALIGKLFEEGGEFSEAILKDNGYLQYKPQDANGEGPIEEAADVMNVVIGILAANYPHKTPEELSSELLQAFVKKGVKYASILS